MIRGFPRQPSPRAGEVLHLHVSTDAPAFRVEFFRCGAAMVPVARSGWLTGVDAPAHLPFQDWTEPGVGLSGEPLAPWPGHAFPVPHDWAPGTYVAVLVEGDGSGRDRSDPDRSTPDGREAKALFVVRPAAPTAPVLYKLPLFTWFAYDLVDGQELDPATRRGHWCAYNTDRLRGLPDVPRHLSVHRPGGGTGAWPYDVGNWDPFDPTPRQTFVHWDAPFLAWLEREGIAHDVCTDLDLHREGAALLAPYRLLLSAGHDEYWSDAMRAALEQHVDRGGSAAFFGGNTMWWRVVVDPEHAFRRTAQWGDGAGEPENALIGVSFRNGGERDRDEHPVRVGLRVQHADSWVYEGTGVRDGDVFGEQEYLVGYECDGADFDRADLEAGRPVVPSGRDGTPTTFTVLGVGDLRPSGWGFGNAAATMGVLPRGAGTVFNGATTDWPRVLAGGRDGVVEQVTRNVIARLSAPDPDRPASPGGAGG